MKKSLPKRARAANYKIAAVIILFGLFGGFAILSFSTGFQETAAQSVQIVATLPSFCSNAEAEFDEQCDGSDLRDKTCVTFGFGSGILGCASCEWNFSSCTGDHEVLASSTFAFANGGNLIVDNSDTTQAIFDFPENFYTADLTLHFFSYANDFFVSTKPSPSGKSFVGKVYDFRLYDFFGDEVNTVLEQITVTIDYLTADLEGLDQDTLAPYLFDTSDSTWQEIAGSILNKDNQRVSFSTNTFSSFALFASEPAPEPEPEPEPTPAPAGGGGGGGGGTVITTVQTGASFSGKAYPGRTITLLQDARIVATTIAGSNANFFVSVTGLTPGSYIFSLYSEDRQGIRSSLSTFPSSITSGTITSVTGIFIAPSLEVDKLEVRRGENIAIFGQTVPSADVTIQIAGSPDFFARTTSDASGIYLHHFNTAVLDYGTHFTKSSSAIGALEVSGFSRVVSFAVSTRTVLKAPPVAVKLRGDLNNDGRVSLVDFSIAAYWYGKPNPPSHVDLNGDGIVNLVDFSIMAFYWTG